MNETPVKIVDTLKEQQVHVNLILWEGCPSVINRQQRACLHSVSVFQEILFPSTQTFCRLLIPGLLLSLLLTFWVFVSRSGHHFLVLVHSATFFGRFITYDVHMPVSCPLIKINWYQTLLDDDYFTTLLSLIFKRILSLTPSLTALLLLNYFYWTQSFFISFSFNDRGLRTLMIPQTFPALIRLLNRCTPRNCFPHHIYWLLSRHSRRLLPLWHLIIKVIINSLVHYIES